MFIVVYSLMCVFWGGCLSSFFLLRDWLYIFCKYSHYELHTDRYPSFIWLLFISYLFYEQSTIDTHKKKSFK